MPSGVRDRLLSLLESHRVHHKGGDTPITHTLIPSGPKSKDGGKFSLPPSQEENLLRKHLEASKKTKIHLTEAQLPDGPLLVDIDLHYSPDVSKRQHTQQDIEKLIALYNKAIFKYTSPESIVEVFVMHKDDVNMLPNKTKDGVHMIFGLAVKRGIQLAIRKDVVSALESGEVLGSLPIINEWSDVVDEAITKGGNWQVYGSCKPDHQAYRVTQHYKCFLSPDGLGFKAPKLENGKDQFDVAKYYRQLSARFGAGDGCAGWPEGVTREDFVHLEVKKNSRAKTIPPGSDIAMCDISSEEELDRAIQYHIYSTTDVLNYRVTETHQFALALPKAYHGPGSYDKWMRVGWALAHTDPRMFVTWVKLSTKEPCRATLAGPDGKFDWKNVQEMWDMWLGFDFSSEEGDGLSYRSVMYWCRQDAPAEHERIKQTTIDYFIDETLDPGRQVKSLFAADGQHDMKDIEKRKIEHTEFDVAQVLYQLYKERFICASIKNNIWYEFQKHRWHEIDSGGTLRMSISKDLYGEYLSRVMSLMKRQTQLFEDDEDEDSPESRYLKWKIVRITKILPTLKQTTFKNNIMREAKELFYDKDFYNELDQNPYLICFRNGIIDFKEKTFRDGRAEDYVSFCTNIDYIPGDSGKRSQEKEVEVKTFMEQLFPEAPLRRYMWQHLASTLIGTLENQTFNMYFGSGRNGKSVLVDLMSKVLGDYKGTVPTSLITQKRPSIGSSSSEIAQLRGVRYAVMQEPSKGDRINEGIMKEITGGDPIQGRALFKDTITFQPQFKLVVCTNTLFEINSNDDGTWRRIRICDFLAKFLPKPYKDPLFPKQRCPYQFPLDKRLEQKFGDWAPVLAYLLVDVAFETQGDVKDCPAVLSASNKYRDEQDKIAQFIRECICPGDEGCVLPKSEMQMRYRQWCKDNELDAKSGDAPKAKEVVAYMDMVYGNRGGKKAGWAGLRIQDCRDEADVDE